jgi:hypothetical protein
MSDLLGKFFRDLEGTFTAIPPSSKLASPTSQNPIAKAHFAMIRELARMHVPQIGVSPEPEEFEDTADYLLRVAAVVDAFVREVGLEVKCNALCLVDLKDFEGVLLNGMEGYCLASIDQAAEAAREAQNEGDAGDRRYDEARW